MWLSLLLGSPPVDFLDQSSGSSIIATTDIRSGSIELIRDALVRANQEYLIAAFVFPRKSEVSVVSKPEALEIQSTKSQNVAYFIGIVKAYIPYQDVAIGIQSKRPRVILKTIRGLQWLIRSISFKKQSNDV
ncbi:hypothetical protein AA81_02300 [Petrotoga halophila DSM 16923]|uniref:Uncharacterized protein n=1 Tax=Petrotoga halophila DSM 16923 TaxID=1122953 RepID=A0A2S5EJP8_9BACT|nr:hypothetical protein AA81_02300 [Petrotoga halophila DSM 16923]